MNQPEDLDWHWITYQITYTQTGGSDVPMLINADYTALQQVQTTPLYSIAADDPHWQKYYVN